MPVTHVQGYSPESQVLMPQLMAFCLFVCLFVCSFLLLYLLLLLLLFLFLVFWGMGGEGRSIN